jgi:hypothetical protein
MATQLVLPGVKVEVPGINWPVAEIEDRYLTFVKEWYDATEGHFEGVTVDLQAGLDDIYQIVHGEFPKNEKE